MTLLDELRQLGAAHVTAHTDQVPAIDAIEPENCYLWWEVQLVTGSGLKAVESVFIFVEDEGEVAIRRRDDQADAVAMLGSVPPDMFETFVAEGRKHLEAMELETVCLRQDPGSKSSLDALFRSVHSFKGNAALLHAHVSAQSTAALKPLRSLAQMSHVLESMLESWREGTPAANAETITDICFEASAAMRMLLEYLVRGEGDHGISPSLLERLGIAPEASHILADARMDGTAAAFHNTATQCIATMELCLERIVTPGEDDDLGLSRAGEVYLRALRTLDTAARYVKLADLEALLSRQIQLLSSSADNSIALHKEEIAELQAALRTMRTYVDTLPASEALAACPPGDPAAIRVKPSATDPPKDKHDAGRDRRVEDRRSAESVLSPVPPATIRIDQGKLDGLMTIVGELLVARGVFPLMLEDLQKQSGSTDQLQLAAFTKNLKEAGSNVSRIADELQRSVMSIRMLPVKTVFQKFPRLVRDLARSLGKEVNLVVTGETIELDKTIVEQLGDPLVHIIRNAVDHGFETPDQRIAQGKSSTGCLKLHAQHEAGGISIEITDDGQGLDAGRLKRKAVEKGLLTSEAAAAMSDQAAYQLVFLPGLSTAAAVTDISGRGVGMDVVQSNVRNLHGTIEIRSRPGSGTTFLIKLPTSLMVSKGILLEAGCQQYILPLNSVCDMVKVDQEAVHRHGSLAIAHVRGSIYPITDLAKLLDLVPTKSLQASIAIIEADKRRYGLVVDRFITEVEVLVKPLTGGLVQCRQFQGAAILGDGRVVLVLNASGCRPMDIPNDVCR